MCLFVGGVGGLGGKMKTTIHHTSDEVIFPVALYLLKCTLGQIPFFPLYSHISVTLFH